MRHRFVPKMVQFHQNGTEIMSWGSSRMSENLVLRNRQLKFEFHYIGMFWCFQLVSSSIFSLHAWDFLGPLEFSPVFLFCFHEPAKQSSLNAPLAYVIPSLAFNLSSSANFACRIFCLASLNFSVALLSACFTLLLSFLPLPSFV